MSLQPIVPVRPGGKVPPATVPLIGKQNLEKEAVIRHIKHNIRLQLPQHKVWNAQKTRVALACGGPSLKTNLKKLRNQVNKGFKLATVNGSHDFLLSEGFRPSIQILVDAREFNARFVQHPIDTCHYFISSQCHPSVFEALKDHDRVYIFHLDIGRGKKDEDGNLLPPSEADEILSKYYLKKFIVVSGGSTVTLNSLVLLRQLGFRYFDIYGFDSCFIKGEDHSYDQPENKEKPVRVVARWGGQERVFYCAAWMVRQAYDFQMLIRAIPDDWFKCRVHGSGLIAHMMKAGCEIDVTNSEEK